MPCTAKKFEKEREEINASQSKDTDAVLTTRELARMIKEVGIKFEMLEDTGYDILMGKHTGAGTIFGTTGGVAEAAVRTVKEKLTGEPLNRLDLGFKGINKAEVVINDKIIRVAIVNGLKNAEKILKEVQKGQSNYDFIEIMACPHGCVGGGGQPLPVDEKTKELRGNSLFHTDRQSVVRKSHKNPMIEKLYSEYLKEPNGSKSHQLLHTFYKKRAKN